MLRSEVVRTMVEPNVKAAVQALAEINQTNESAITRLALRFYTEAQIAEFELRIAAAEQLGLTDLKAHQFLSALRDAYFVVSDN